MPTDPTVQENERIEAILANLQQEIDRHRQALGHMGALEPADPLATVRQAKWVNPHLPIGWPEMPKGLVAKLVAYTQKIVRRLLAWYINPIVSQQNHYNEAVFAQLEAIHANVGSVAGELHALADNMPRDLAATAQGAQAAREQMAVEIGADLTAKASALDVASQRQDTLDALLNALIPQVESLQAAAEAHESIITDERSRRAHDSEVVRFRLQRLENTSRQGDPAQPGTSEQPVIAADVDYYLLGLLHRSEEQLAQRLTDYDDLAPRCSAGPWLDLGCGRGDFVAYLTELGVDARGIDIDAEAVAMGRELGRDVAVGDMFAVLADQEDASLGAISAIQVIEHLDWAAMQRFFALAQRKLATGGFVLVETVNPTCVTALTNAYLLDPSHVVPVHPQMAQFLLEGSGLADVELRLLHPVAPEHQLEPTGDQVAQRNWQKLNGILYGPQDYAAIAYKHEDA